MLLEIYSILIALSWIFLSFYLVINGGKIKYLSFININENKIQPSVAIIIAARNEEEKLKEALISLCNLDYNNYKILIVNDRSTDNSGKILAELQAKYEKISIVNIEKLPLKNELLYQKEKIIERVNEALGEDVIKEVVIK